jgi:hypothetical protein
MRKFFALALLSGALLCGWSARAQADTMGSSMSGAASGPIHVNRCAPSQTTNVHNAYPVGYSAAYYPYRGPYRYNDVYGRYYTQPSVTTTSNLAIDYVNKTENVMKTIDFGLVVNGRLVAEVRDEGTFSPGAEIKHEFGLNPNVFPIQTSFAQCVPLQIVYHNGTHWKNPHLPSLQNSIYGH